MEHWIWGKLTPSLGRMPQGIIEDCNLAEDVPASPLSLLTG